MYDVAVVGAGPAGLMAAKTAAQSGLKVIVVEKRRDVSQITRACCEQWIMDEDFEGETIRIDGGRVEFIRNRFSVDYDGPLHPVTDKYFYSPSGNRIHFANEDNSPIVVKFDKGRLLQILWEQCEQERVAFMPGTVVYGARDGDDGVTLSVTQDGTHSTVTARKIVIADGVNAGLADKMGLNAERSFFGTGLCIIYHLEGIGDFEPSALKTYFGRSYMGMAPLLIGPSMAQDGAGYLVVTGNKKMPPEQLFATVTQKGALSPQLKNARIVKKVGCTVKAYSSMRNPCRGNVLVIGDAAAYVEVEVQGGLMCGFRAGNAVAQELNGYDGFEEYTSWWSESFEFNSNEALRVAQGFVLVPTYTDEEIDYLFSLIQDEVLEGTYNQYKSPRLMWDAILKHSERIAAEYPDIHNKMTKAQVSLKDMLG